MRGFFKIKSIYFTVLPVSLPVSISVTFVSDPSLSLSVLVFLSGGLCICLYSVGHWVLLVSLSLIHTHTHHVAYEPQWHSYCYYSLVLAILVSIYAPSISHTQKFLRDFRVFAFIIHIWNKSLKTSLRNWLNSLMCRVWFYRLDCGLGLHEVNALWAT